MAQNQKQSGWVFVGGLLAGAAVTAGVTYGVLQHRRHSDRGVRHLRFSDSPSYRSSSPFRNRNNHSEAPEEHSHSKTTSPTVNGHRSPSPLRKAALDRADARQAEQLHPRDRQHEASTSRYTGATIDQDGGAGWQIRNPPHPHLNLGPSDRSNSAARDIVAQHPLPPAVPHEFLAIDHHLRRHSTALSPPHGLPANHSHASLAAHSTPGSGNHAHGSHGGAHSVAGGGGGVTVVPSVLQGSFAHTHVGGWAPAHTLPASDMMTEGKIIEDAALYEQYCRVITPEPGLNDETEDVCALLKQCYDLREKWLFKPAVAPAYRSETTEVAAPSQCQPHPFRWQPQEVSPLQFEMVDGVYRCWTDDSHAVEAFPLPGNAYDFFSDMHRILKVQAMGAVRTFCHHRLLLLEQKFNLHVMLNADKEFLAQKSAPHRDFYNVRKVDTHVHHSACMHQKHLLRFMKSKLRHEPDEMVIFRDGKYLTLREVFESLQLTGYDLNVDTLDMHADKNTFHRFDKFNLKYNPCGQSRLREIFIKQDNLIHGRFLAELTKQVLSDLEASKYQHAEYRISIYGRKCVEWDILAAWMCQNQIYSDNVVWLIQIPRLYSVYREQGIVENFEQMLDNIFGPLFEVTADPNSHPQLHLFLQQVVGFDMVDDESKPERRPSKHMQSPAEWNLKHNPAYSYYAYYAYANLYTLNKFRESRGLNTFAFRPHAGEAGDIDHLATSLMLCENIAHGINLRKSPCLQYLYYLAQIGLCMSPLSNNSLFLDYHRNPLPTFFARGLNVSLSTDDPLQIHLTKEPLVEEYSIAAQVWKLSATDLCEIARNSVLHSGFPHQVKMHWVHRYYYMPGPQGNDIHKTNVPNLRMRFRHDTHSEEMAVVMEGAAAHYSRKHIKAQQNGL